MSDLTKKALGNSLKNLLLKKSLNEITVSDITDDCGVNRQTFYYHFNNIPDLLEWVCISDSDKILKENRHYDNWEDGFYSVFVWANSNKAFVMNIYHSVSLKVLLRYLDRLVNPLLMNVINEQTYGLMVKQEDKEFIANFYTNSYVGLVINWIDKGMNEDPKDIIKHLTPIVKGTVRQALVTYSKEEGLSQQTLAFFFSYTQIILCRVFIHL